MNSANYRPNMEDFNPTKAQQLSLKAAGEFDAKFHILTSDGKVMTRQVTTNWHLVCLDRALRGVSRKAMIAAKKPAARQEEVAE